MTLFTQALKSSNVTPALAGFSHWCQIYPDDETVGSLPAFKEGRYEFSCCYYDGKVFMFGGFSGRKVFKNMECFDIGKYYCTKLMSYVK